MNLCRDCLHCDGCFARPALCLAIGKDVDYVTGIEGWPECRKIRAVFGAECPHWTPKESATA